MKWILLAILSVLVVVYGGPHAARFEDRVVKKIFLRW